MIPLMFLINSGTPPTPSYYSGTYLPCTSNCIPSCTTNCDNTFTHPVNIGDVFEGGYYAGAVKISGEIHALILSEKAKGFISNTKISSTAETFTTTEINSIPSYDGAAYTNLFMNKFKSNISSTTKPLLYSIQQLNAVGFGLNGQICNDWYIPALQEWLTIWHNLNPVSLPTYSYTTGDNNVLFSLPCQKCGIERGSTIPVTTHTLFKNNVTGTETLYLPFRQGYIMSNFAPNSTTTMLGSVPIGESFNTKYQFLSYPYFSITGWGYPVHCRLIRKVKLN